MRKKKKTIPSEVSKAANDIVGPRTKIVDENARTAGCIDIDARSSSTCHD
jgi:hypothetical protein